MKLLLTVLLLLSPAAPAQISQQSISSINAKGVDFTIETSKVDNPVAYESGLYRHHAQMEMLFPNALRWDHSSTEIAQLTVEHIKFANDTINALVKTEGCRTFENTIEPLAKYDHEWATMTTSIGFYSQVSPSKEIREAAKEYEKRLGSFQTDLDMREDYYQAVKSYKTEADKDGSFAKLDTES
jgi:Zn-dependent oligopeptidase